MTETFRFGRVARLFALTALLAPILAACGGGGGTVGSSGVKRAAFTSKEFGVAVSPRATTAKHPPRGGGRELPLRSYVVAGKTYQPVAGPGYVERGQASWYGQDFHGRRTANGEIFGAYYLTAASPVLPIPSYARVTNLDNGRSILVRINDRGPYLNGRIIDLSYQAASALGYVNQGRANVEVRYVGPAPLHGDEERMLTASLNRLTPAEQRMGFDTGMRVAQNDAPVPAGRPNGRGNILEDISGLFAYADGDPVNAAHAAATAMASRDTGLAQWVDLVDEDARDITVRLGVFRDAEAARKVAESFALLGAVDEQQVDAGGGAATAVTLIHLKPGVARADVLVMARELGLNDVVLYQ